MCWISISGIVLKFLWVCDGFVHQPVWGRRALANCRFCRYFCVRIFCVAAEVRALWKDIGCCCTICTTSVQTDDPKWQRFQYFCALLGYRDCCRDINLPVSNRERNMGMSVSGSMLCRVPLASVQKGFCILHRLYKLLCLFRNERLKYCTIIWLVSCLCIYSVPFIAPYYWWSLTWIRYQVEFKVSVEAVLNRVRCFTG